MGEFNCERSKLIETADIIVGRDPAMNPIRILVDSFADAWFLNAQMGNAREIACRLDPKEFHVSMFVLGTPDPRIASRGNTRLIQLPRRRQTVPILREFLRGAHQILFYVKASPASRWYMSWRGKWRDRRTVVGTMESQADFKTQPSISLEAVRLWEHTVLRSDYLFSNSASVQKSLEREYGVHSQIIPTGVDTKFFSPAREQAENPRLRVLFAGSLRSFKQPHILLDAAARFPDADFIIAGDGPSGPDLMKRVEREALRNVRFCGMLNADQLRTEYRTADIFLFPSVWEGSPKVILEAAACGLPVIARNNYAPETVLHGVTGYQATSDDEIFSFLRRLLENPEHRRDLGRHGTQHSQKYDWDLIAGRWAETFIELANAPAARRAC